MRMTSPISNSIPFGELFGEIRARKRRFGKVGILGTLCVDASLEDSFTRLNLKLDLYRKAGIEMWSERRACLKEERRLMSHNPKWFQSVEKKPLPKAPAFSKTLQIDKVVPGSPAADLNLRPGDKLLSVNGKAALIEDIPALLAKSNSVQYRFFLPCESAILEVATRGLPLGFEASVSSDGIFEQYKSKSEFNKEGLLTLWERGDYDHIREACAISNKRLNKRNLVGKLIGKPKSFPFTEMMLAICDIEAGKGEAGYDALGTYQAKHAYGETSDVQCILEFYNGLKAKSDGSSDAYRRMIESAYTGYPDSDRIRAEAIKAGVEVDRQDLRIGLKVNLNDEWRVLEGGQGTQTLGGLLDAMAPGQVLPLCLMTAYRGNGPYNDALLPYIALQPHVSERLHPLVVLTYVEEKRKDRPHWNANEAAAKSANCTFIVLHGSTMEIIEDYRPQAAPEFVAVDKSGTIVWAGCLSTDYAYWDMLDKTTSR